MKLHRRGQYAADCRCAVARSVASERARTCSGNSARHGGDPQALRTATEVGSGQHLVGGAVGAAELNSLHLGISPSGDDQKQCDPEANQALGNSRSSSLSCCHHHGSPPPVRCAVVVRVVHGAAIPVKLKYKPRRDVSHPAGVVTS